MIKFLIFNKNAGKMKKIKLSDIKNALNRDELRTIKGGCNSSGPQSRSGCPSVCRANSGIMWTRYCDQC